jgi:hypothetical protein
MTQLSGSWEGSLHLTHFANVKQNSFCHLSKYNNIVRHKLLNTKQYYEYALAIPPYKNCHIVFHLGLLELDFK